MKSKRLFKVLATALMMLSMGIGSQAQSGWQEVYLGTDMFMRDICFVPGDDGLWQTGWAISFEGDIIKTTDGGDTWTVSGQNHSTALAGISFADEDNGFIATLDNKILKSTDGGSSWSIVYNGTANFDKIAMKDASNGVASGTAKLYTNDGGTTWATGTGGSTYWDLDHAANDTYYGVNLGGSLGRSTDGGVTWADIDALGNMCFMTDFMDETHGMFGGDLSKIKVTHDGGNSWISSTLGGGQDAINCGGFFDPDTIYAAGSSGEVFKSTDGGNNWVTDTTWASGVVAPRGLVVTGMNAIFVAGWNSNDEGVIWRKVGFPPIDAFFEADATDVCEGSTVAFTDLSVGNIDSWTWTFEGGSPAASTDQNPTVTYAVPGDYDVKLVVTIGLLEDSLTLEEYIHVYELPAQADQPDGPDAICTDADVTYTTSAVPYAQDYEWELNPPDAGTVSWELNEATVAVADDWTGDFTLRVRATNVCGDGDWSDNLEGTVYQSPDDDFNITGGGGYCLNSDGVEVGLDGSETGVDYELYLDALPTGNIVSGTGSAISFGLVTDEGYYTAIGMTDYCTEMMIGQVQVFLEFPPLEPETPTGPEAVCNDEVSVYESEGTDDADSYVWVLSPEDAGTITFEELEATVEWDAAFSGTASVSLYGINECGDGNLSNELQVSVEAIPVPEISGMDTVCDNHLEDYSVADHEGSTYAWEVTGGTIYEGQGTAMITVEWGDAGTGMVTVSEETTNGCVGESADFEVFIDDCTAIDENRLDRLTVVYPNPADREVYVRSELQVGQLSVYNLTGDLLLTTEPLNREVKLNLSHFRSGTYLLRISTAEGSVTKRLVIK